MTQPVENSLRAGGRQAVGRAEGRAAWGRGEEVEAGFAPARLPTEAPHQRDQFGVSRGPSVFLVWACPSRLVSGAPQALDPPLTEAKPEPSPKQD